MRRAMRLILPLLLLSAAMIGGCVNNDNAPSNAGTNNTTMGSSTNMTMMTATIELGDTPAAPGAPASAGPGSMYLKATGMDALVVGKPVMVNVTNKGTTTHDVVASGTDFKVADLAAGKSVVVTWTPTKDGTFDIYCDKGADPTGQVPIADHRAQGMAGKMTVKKA